MNAANTMVEAPLRVAMIVHAYYERDARVRRYAETLVRAGHKVDVLALRGPGDPRRQVLKGVNVIRMPLRRRRGGIGRYVLEYLAFTFLASLMLSLRHLENRYDVVHVHNMPDFLVFAAWLPKLTGCKVILDAHDLMPEVHASKFGVSSSHPITKLLNLQERISNRFADAVIFSSDLLREIALRRGSCDPQQTITVLNSPDPTIFDRNRHPWRGPDDATEFRLLYVGTVSPRHGVDQAVRAVALLADDIPGMRLLIYPRLAEGEGDALDDLRRLVEHEQLERVIEFRDPIPLDQIPHEMALAHVGLFTPRLDAHIDVALSIKVPEFVAMSVPIVTTKTRVMQRYFADDQVSYFEDGDIDSCAHAIRRIFEDPEEARLMARRADRFLREHSWQVQSEQYMGLLSRLVFKTRSGLPRQPAGS
jgi:glycosyltransferase involved in cell wall biosynthesis